MANSAPKPIYKIDPETEAILEEFSSVNKAVEKYGADIWRVLSGKRKVAGGFKWAYVPADELTVESNYGGQNNL